MFRQKVRVHHIFSSSEHNYFTREKFDIGTAPTLEHKEIQLSAGKGVDGDRFEFSKYPLTLFSLEVAEEVCKSLEIECDLKLFRRNIIVSGVHLTSLIGERFFIGDVEFEGLAHCNPCPWMNAAMKKGAYALMRGRGGLRVRIVKAGTLSCGDAELKSVVLVNEDPLTPLKLSKIPSA